jgi:dynein intermediate chain 2
VHTEYASEPPSTRTLAVFQDPNEIKRAATKISWHPDLDHKVAVSYSCTQFQQMPDKMPMASYIWDVNKPNAPDATVLPQSPLCCLVYNPRSPDHLVGGSYNGMLGFWDLRKGKTPVCVSDLEHSHHDPVQDCFWIQSRTGNECCSISTDGQLLWWDVRQLDKGPTDSMVLEGTDEQVYGGTCMDYKSEAGATRYLMGTEQGVVLLADRKAKKDAESTKSIKTIFGQNGRGHHGPIYSIHRNPSNVKYFLTVGDWTARVFMEDLKSPLMTTPYDGSYLTGACWSPTRPGVFFTTKVDGTMDAWDYHYKQNEPLFTTKVGQSSLTAIACQQHGSKIALGAEDGTTTILSMSRALSEQQPGEKHSVANMLERETRREKNLEVRRMLQSKTRGGGSKGGSRGGPRPKSGTEAVTTVAEGEMSENNKDMLAKLEKDFFDALKGKGASAEADEEDE